MLWTLNYITQLYKRTKNLASKIQVDQERPFIATRKDNIITTVSSTAEESLFVACQICLRLQTLCQLKIQTRKKIISQDDIHLTFTHLQHNMIEGSAHQYTSIVVSNRWGSCEPFVLQLAETSLGHKEKLFCVCEKYLIPLTYQMI